MTCCQSCTWHGSLGGMTTYRIGVIIDACTEELFKQWQDEWLKAMHICWQLLPSCTWLGSLSDFTTICIGVIIVALPKELSQHWLRFWPKAPSFNGCQICSCLASLGDMTSFRIGVIYCYLAKGSVFTLVKYLLFITVMFLELLPELPLPCLLG